MKVQQRSTGLMADIVINKTDGMETAAFVKEQMTIFPPLAPLVLFLKLFLAQRNLHVSAQEGASWLQEFRYGSMGISVLNGGSLFDREKRGFTTRTRSGQATLCLESPADPRDLVGAKEWSTEDGLDIGARVFKIGIIRAAFNHGYHIPGSLLCPYLLRRDHPLISQRFRLFNEQPGPFLELVGRPESDDERQPQEPITKKRRSDEHLAPLTLNVGLDEPKDPRKAPKAPAPTPKAQVEVTKEITPAAPEEPEALDIVEEIGDALEAWSKIKIFKFKLPALLMLDGWLTYEFLAAAETVGDDDQGDLVADDGYGLNEEAESLLELDPEMLAEEQRKLQEQIRRLEEATAWDDL
eukprot:Skav210605  [mRNA]  locus=scaffold234:74391:82575:+ [translate_table: standard]